MYTTRRRIVIGLTTGVVALAATTATSQAANPVKCAADVAAIKADGAAVTTAGNNLTANPSLANYAALNVALAKLSSDSAKAKTDC